jgi:hypothetical protein
MKVTEAVKLRLLQEFMLDYDWSAAAKRVGITPNQLVNIKRDEKYMRIAERGLEKAIVDGADLDGAVKRFRQTQEILAKELEGGNMSVASSLMKSHEIEFRQHGLFEKDNGQKNMPVQVNIVLQQPERGVVIDGEKA